MENPSRRLLLRCPYGEPLHEGAQPGEYLTRLIGRQFHTLVLKAKLPELFAFFIGYLHGCYAC